MNMYNKTNHDYRYLIFLNFLSEHYLSKLRSKLYKKKVFNVPTMDYI